MREKTDRSGYLFTNKMLAALILPLIVEQLLAILVGMADSIMIASVGEAAVSGVSLVDQIMVLFINGFAALATGGAVVAGQYLGMRDKEKAKDAAKQLIWFITACALVITLLTYVGKSFILHVVFGAIDADVMRHANTYLMIVTASIPFIALYNGGAAIFRAMGNSKMSMIVSILMNGINVCGNAVLIYGFHRDTEGVAIPTLVSRMVAAIVILLMLCRDKYPIYFENLFSYRPDGKMIRRILSIGVPNGLENSLFQLGKILVLSLISTFGTYAIAANAVSNTVALFQILPGLAMGLAITTVVSRCVGAGDYKQAKYYTRKMLMITYLSMWFMNGVVFVLLPIILKAYHLSDLTAVTTEKILCFHSICCMIIWPVSFSLPCTLRAAGDARIPMIISIASMWTFRIGFSYILGKYMGWGVFGVWVAMIIDWVFRSVMMLLRYLSGRWMTYKTI